ncbi:GNAT family N-acetyltransferase [Virgibacillus xinjiangensis]|uniref:GNAT family N-acetyltransferase n=1 Tax=Virgibacillus xinjiangensis TaxID=393090 RepID=A0ABV7CYB0_9BACI
MEFVIRRAGKKDIKHIQQVAVTSWNATYKGIIPLEIQKKFLQNAYSAKTMKKRLKHTHLFVAEADDRIVGFANFSDVKERGRVELGAIYLYPHYQGKGIGSALLQEGIDQLGGVEEVYLNVEKQNEIGKNFYHAKGFEQVSEFQDTFDGHILNTLQMVLKVENKAGTA